MYPPPPPVGGPPGFPGGGGGSSGGYNPFQPPGGGGSPNRRSDKKKGGPGDGGDGGGGDDPDDSESEDSSVASKGSKVSAVLRKHLARSKHKEADDIKIRGLPAIPAFRAWKNLAYQSINAASGRPDDDAMKWAMQSEEETLPEDFSVAFLKSSGR